MLKTTNKYLLMASLLILFTNDLIYFINVGFSYLIRDLNFLIVEFNMINLLFFVYSISLLFKSFLLITSIYIIFKQKRFFKKKKIATILAIYFFLYLFVHLYLNLWVVNFDTSKLNLNVYLQSFGTLTVVMILYFILLNKKFHLFINIRSKYFYIFVLSIYTITFAFDIVNYLSINNWQYIIYNLNIIFISVYIISKMNILQKVNRETQVSLYN